MAESKIPVVLLVTAQRDASFQSVIRGAEAELKRLGSQGAGALREVDGAAATEGLKRAGAAAKKAADEIQAIGTQGAAGLKKVESATEAAASKLQRLAQLGKQAAEAVAKAGDQPAFRPQVSRGQLAALANIGQSSAMRAAAPDLATVRNPLSAFAGLDGLQGDVPRKLEQTKVRMTDLVGVSKALNTTLESVQEHYRKTAAEAVEFGTAAGVSLLGAAAAGGALLGYAARAAGEFEQLRAKLETVQHSATKAAETFEFARELAAKTPFDVREVVAAAVQLEVYGARAQEVLPLVADLAAGMGKDIESTALVFGKAMSGSLEGFESLRNEYGISSAKLAQFGAVLTKTGGISVQTAGDLQKAQEALQRIVQTQFGGAVERQSRTLQGALSNAGDSVQNLAAAFGDDLVPLVTMGARVFSTLVDKVAATPGPIRTVGSVTAALGVGLAAMAGTAVVATTALVAMNTQLDAAALKMPQLAGAASLTSGALSAVGAAARGVGTAFSFLATHPIGRVITLAAAAALAGTGAINAYADAQERVSERLREESQQLQQATKDWRLYKGAVEAATGKQIADSRSAVEAAVELAEALKKAKPEDIVNAARERGIDAASLREAVKAQESLLQSVQEQMKQAAADKDAAMKAWNFTEAEAAQQRLEQLAVTLQNVTKNRDAAQMLLEVFQNFEGPLDASVAGFQKLDSYLKFAEKAGDVRSLTEALGVLRDGLDEMAQKGRELKLPVDDPAALRRRLQTLSPDSSEFKWIETYLERLAKVEDAVEKVNAANKAALDERLALMDEEYEAAHAGRDEDLKAEQEHLAAKLAAVREAREKRIREMDETFRKEHEGEKVSVAEKRQHEKEKAEAVRSFRVEETKLRNEAHQNEESRQQKFLSDFKDRVAAALQGVQDLAASGGATAGQVADGYRNVLRFVDEWIARNKALLDQFPELRKAANDIREDAEKPTQQAEKAATSDKVNDLKKQAQDSISDARGPEAQLEATRRGIALLERALRTDQDIRASKDAQKAVQEEINRLRRSERDIVEQIADKERQLAQQTQSLRLQAIDQDIRSLEMLGGGGLGSNRTDEERERARQEVLQAGTVAELQAIAERLAAGVAAEEAMIAKRSERYEAELTLLQMELQATLEAVGASEAEKAAAHQRYVLKKRMLDESERQRMLQALGQEVKATEDAERRKQAARDRSNRIGGAKSPMMTGAEAFGGPNAFSIGDFSLDSEGFSFNGAGVNEQIQKAKPKASTPMDQTAADLEKFRTALNDNATVPLTELAPPTRALGDAATTSATNVTSLGAAASAAAAALQGLGAGAGGGEKSDLPPAPEGTTNDGNFSYAPGAGPKGAQPGAVGNPNTKEFSFNGPGPNANVQQQANLRFPTPAQMGAVAFPVNSKSVAAAAVAQSSQSEVRQSVYINGAEINGNPSAQGVAREAARLVVAEQRRGRLMKGPWG